MCDVYRGNCHSCELSSMGLFGEVFLRALKGKIARANLFWFPEKTPLQSSNADLAKRLSVRAFVDSDSDRKNFPHLEQPLKPMTLFGSLLLADIEVLNGSLPFESAADSFS